MPEGGIKRGSGGPVDWWAVSFSGGIFDAPGRSDRGQIGEGVDISVEGIGIVDVPRASVDLIHAVAAVEIGERGDRWSDPGCSQSILSGNVCAVIGVEIEQEVFRSVSKAWLNRCSTRKLTFVGMTEEDISDNMRCIPRYNLVEQIRRIRHGIGLPRRDQIMVTKSQIDRDLLRPILTERGQ